MKKTITAIALVLAIALSMSGLAFAKPTQAPVPEEESFISGSVPAESAALDGMIPPVNALVMSMLEQGLVYDESDDVFIWNSLYYMISLYGQMDQRAELTDDSLILPTEMVQDYAAALFVNYRGLPQLPAEMTDRVRYDAAQDSYLLARGDAGLTETRLDSARPQSGKVQVSGALVALEDGSELCRFQAVLVPNDSMFGYAIAGLTIL